MFFDLQDPDVNIFTDTDTDPNPSIIKKKKVRKLLCCGFFLTFSF
jgi:hypothetical protein